MILSEYVFSSTKKKEKKKRSEFVSVYEHKNM